MQKERGPFSTEVKKKKTILVSVIKTKNKKPTPFSKQILKRDGVGGERFSCLKQLVFSCKQQGSQNLERFLKNLKYLISSFGPKENVSVTT